MDPIRSVLQKLEGQMIHQSSKFTLNSKIYQFKIRIVIKKCSKCQTEKPELEFNWKLKNKSRTSYCKECSRSYIRSHYQNNKKYYLNKAKQRNIKLRDILFKFLGEYLLSHPCVDCEESDILVLEFDHKDRMNKTFSISTIVRRRLNIEELVIEVSKCDVRCANCHRRKTEKENNSWKLKYAPVA